MPDSKKATAVFDLILAMKSNNWRIRSQAYAKLCRISDSEQMNVLVYDIRFEKDSAVAYSCTRVARRWLNRTDISQVSKAVCLLFYISSHEFSEVSRFARKTLAGYVYNANNRRPFAFIVETMRLAWPSLDERDRVFFTELVRDYKIHNLVPCILDSLEGVDEDLQILTLKTVARLKNERAKRSLLKLARSDNTKLAREALLALAEVGNFWDGFFVRPNLDSGDEDVLIAAIRCQGKLLQRFAMRLLHRIYFEQNSVAVKQEVIRQLGRIEHKNATDFLFRILMTEKNPQLKSLAEWAVMENRHEISVQSLFEVFDKADMTGKFLLMHFMGQLYHEHCYQRLLQIIRAEENDFLVISALESVSLYHRPETTIELLPFLKRKHYAHRAAVLAALLENGHIDRVELIESILKETDENDFQVNIVLLKALADLSIGQHIHESAHHFIIKCLTNSKIDLQILALEASKNVFNAAVFKTILQLRADTNNDHLLQLCNEALGTLLVENPFYLNYKFDLLHDFTVIEQIKDLHVDYNFTKKLVRYLTRHYEAKIAEVFFDQFRNSLTRYCLQHLRTSQNTAEQEMVLRILLAGMINPEPEEVIDLFEGHFPGAPIEQKKLLLQICTKYARSFPVSIFLPACLELENKNLIGPEYLANYVEAI